MFDKKVIKSLLKGMSVAACFCAMNTNSYGECTHELLMNASFDDTDANGVPFAWSPPSSNTMGYSIDEGILKMWVKESGNATEGEGSILFSQKFLNDGQSVLGRKVYCRAWVKNTQVVEPTPEDLPCIGERNENTTQEVNGTKCHSGAQLLVQQSIFLPGPPWFGWKEWNTFYDNDGSALTEWTKVEGEFDARTDVTDLICRVFLRSNNSCTLWVDNIQISTEPDFCNEPFDKPGTVRTKPSISKKNSSLPISIINNQIHFSKPVTYTFQVVTPNGKQLVKSSGYGAIAKINIKDLAPGFYIVHVTSDLGNISKSIVVQNAK